MLLQGYRLCVILFLFDVNSSAQEVPQQRSVRLQMQVVPVHGSGATAARRTSPVPPRPESAETPYLLHVRKMLPHIYPAGKTPHQCVLFTVVSYN